MMLKKDNKNPLQLGMNDESFNLARQSVKKYVNDFGEKATTKVRRRYCKYFYLHFMKLLHHNVHVEIWVIPRISFINFWYEK